MTGDKPSVVDLAKDRILAITKEAVVLPALTLGTWAVVSYMTFAGRAVPAEYRDAAIALLAVWGVTRFRSG